MCARVRDRRVIKTIRAITIVTVSETACIVIVSETAEIRACPEVFSNFLWVRKGGKPTRVDFIVKSLFFCYKEEKLRFFLFGGTCPISSNKSSRRIDLARAIESVFVLARVDHRRAADRYKGIAQDRKRLQEEERLLVERGNRTLYESIA